jgi:hypothetical protein
MAGEKDISEEDVLELYLMRGGGGLVRDEQGWWCSRAG